MQARVKTSAGKIDVGLEINLKSSFYGRCTLSANLTDPLAISLDGSPVGLRKKKIKFDIDADGLAYRISVLKKVRTILR